MHRSTPRSLPPTPAKRRTFSMACCITNALSTSASITPTPPFPSITCSACAILPDSASRRAFAISLIAASMFLTARAAHAALTPMIGGAVDFRLIGENWDETLRLAASIKAGTVAPSALMRRLAASAKQNALAKTLREMGRLERTLFTLDWISDPALRRRANAGLPDIEAEQRIARAVFFHRLGEIRDRTFENQKYRASGLNLAVAAVILWNTVYLGRAVTELHARGEAVATICSPMLPRSAGSTSPSTETTSGRPGRSNLASGLCGTRAHPSSTPLRVRFETNSAMTPRWRGADGRPGGSARAGRHSRP